MIDGRLLANHYAEILKEHIVNGKPGLAAILVGNNPASQIYINRKREKALEIGINFRCIELPCNVSPETLIEKICDLNHDVSVHGIILQLPLPKPLNAGFFLQKIAPEKDVDGLHASNLGSLFQERITFAPCTPQGCVQLIKSVHSSIAGKKALILGRSNLVGKSLFHLLLREDATVQMAHSKSLHIKQLCHAADIIIAAMGVPLLIDDTYVKDHQTIIDVGISKVGGLLHGDVDFEKVAPIVQYITPVPGGVGPMTVFNLMLNTVLAYLRSSKQQIPPTLKELLPHH